uniref:Methyltransferase KIAA1456 n=1 Tax=Caligus rogercresseyi TaxID=217165 RepID=C1BP55_CALRO|nr:methyltransferase KIAA1456 [Caligus rogercresseyi]
MNSPRHIRVFNSFIMRIRRSLGHLTDNLKIESWNVKETKGFMESLKWPSEESNTLNVSPSDFSNFPEAFISYSDITVHRCISADISFSNMFNKETALIFLGSSFALNLSHSSKSKVFIPEDSLVHISGELQSQLTGVRCISDTSSGSLIVLRKPSSVEIDKSLAAQLESTHVHSVYESIAGHFSDTRHKPWPKVLEFLNSLDPKGLLIDVGCGNGKYFGHHPDMLQIGCDHSFGLLGIVRDRGFEGVRCDALALPFRSNLADAIISIAVIHHLSTWERRLSTLKEMVRVLKVGGRFLIYAWAKDQKKSSKSSSYLKHNKKEPQKEETSEIPEHSPFNLPVHTNRTDFQHNDLLVPWKKKTKSDSMNEKVSEETIFHRYYHMFQEGELEGLIRSLDGVELEDIYYEQGNWCAIARKT